MLTTVFTNTRRAFIKDFKQNENKYFDNQINIFPLVDIEETAKYIQNINEKFLEENNVLS